MFQIWAGAGAAAVNKVDRALAQQMLTVQTGNSNKAQSPRNRGSDRAWCLLLLNERRLHRGGHGREWPQSQRMWCQSGEMEGEAMPGRGGSQPHKGMCAAVCV